MAEQERSGADIRAAFGDDVTAATVTIRQGGARSVSADEVRIRQGGAGRVHATDIEITQGGVAVAASNEPRDGSALAARGEIVMDQAAAGIVAAGSAQVRDSAIGVLLAGRVDGERIRVLVGREAAFAFGAGVGLVLWLLGRWRR